MSQKIQYLREGKITSELKTGELILDTLTVMREFGGWGILYSRSLVVFFFFFLFSIFYVVFMYVNP